MAQYNWHGRTVSVTMASAKAWPKLAGERPTEAMLDAAAAMLAHTGTAKHLATAMYLREAGCTQPELIMATGDTGHTAKTDALLFGCRELPILGRNGHKAYKLALPGKGKGKPATGKGKLKGKPATGKPAATLIKGKLKGKPAATSDNTDNGNGAQ